jgi:uncharacterized protein YkwD
MKRDTTVTRQLLTLAVLLTAPLLTACGAGDFLGPRLNKSSGTPAGESMTPSELGLAHQVLEAVNREREAEGLPALAWHEEAADVAYDHCVDMRRRGYISHYNPEGQDGCSRLWAAGIDMLSCAENIAHGHQSPTGVLSSFMNSPGHRANILMDGLTHLGVGVHTGAGGPWWTLDFVFE